MQLLQKNEERLRFWGVERSDDPNLAGDLLQEFGLWLDRRREFPRKVAELNVPGERPVAASMLAPVRRVLADSVSQERERAPFGRRRLSRRMSSRQPDTLHATAAGFKTRSLPGSQVGVVHGNINYRFCSEADSVLPCCARESSRHARKDFPSKQRAGDSIYHGPLTLGRM